MTTVASRAQISISKDVVHTLTAGRPSASADDWANDVACALDRLPHGVVIRLGPHLNHPDDAPELAKHVIAAVAQALERKWCLTGLEVEFDRPQVTEIEQGRATRTLLPHHDGGNASFLSPSMLEVPWWRAEYRSTKPKHVSTTRQHKLYQGFLVREVGTAKSLTPYYDLVPLARQAYRHQLNAATVNLPTLAAWVGSNIRSVAGQFHPNEGGYIQLGGILGATRLHQVAVNLHHTDKGPNSEVIARFEALRRLQACTAPGSSFVLALLDEILKETTGLTWQSVRERFELTLQTERNDLVLGHNIMLMHGGIDGGAGRILDPICFVLERPEGLAYERWLSAAWHSAFARCEQPPMLGANS